MLILADMTSNILMLAGVLLLTILVMSSARRKHSTRLAKGLSSRERMDQARQLSGTHNDLCEVMSRLEEVSRHFAAQLDAKAIQLQLMMEEAEVMIQRLRQAQGLPPESTPRAAPAPRASLTPPEIAAGDGTPGNPGTSGNHETSGSPGTPGNPSRSEYSDLLATAQSSSDNKNTEAKSGGSSAYASRASSASRASDPAAGTDPAMQHLNRQVYQLADAGLTTADIAKNLQQHVGKVELILALRQA